MYKSSLIERQHDSLGIYVQPLAAVSHTTLETGLFGGGDYFPHPFRGRKFDPIAGARLGHHVVSAIGKLDEIRRRMGYLREEALRLKDTALLWVFIAEWFIMTATSMVAGFALWSLMVRRRLYMDIQVTRLHRQTQ